MTKTRTWSAATAVLCVLLIVAAYFLLIAPKRAEAADLRDQTVAQDQANQQSRLKIQQLKAQYAELPSKQAELAVIKQQLPDNPALPTLIRTLTSMADASGVTLVSLAPAPPTAVVVAAAPVVAPAVAPAAAAAGAPVTAPVAAAPAAPTTSLFGIATTMIIKGDYAASTLFVQKLQAAGVAKEGTQTAKAGAQMARAFLVQSIKVAPNADAATATKATKGQVQTSITGQVFVLKTAAIPPVSVPSAG